MKKIYFAAVAVAALTFAACGNSNKTETTAEDSTAVEAPADSVTVEAQLDEVTAALESGDEAAVTTGVQNIQNKIQELVAAGKTEEATTYVQKLQEWYNTNKEKVTEVVKDAKNVEGIQQVVETATKTLEDAGVNVEDAKAVVTDKANEVKDQVTEKANEKVNEAKQKATDKVNEAKQKATDKVNEAVDKAANKAADKAGEAASKAVNKMFGK